MTSSDETELDPRRSRSCARASGNTWRDTIDGRGVRIAHRRAVASTVRITTAAPRRRARRAALTPASIEVTSPWAGCPGAFELPLLALAFADGDRPVRRRHHPGCRHPRRDDATTRSSSGECARGVQDVQLSTRVPVVFGVLTVNTLDQALERSFARRDQQGSRGGR